jgi:hypothetical protein
MSKIKILWKIIQGRFWLVIAHACRGYYSGLISREFHLQYVMEWMDWEHNIYILEGILEGLQKEWEGK